MPTSEQVKAYFDSVASDWDRMRQSYYGVEVIEKALAAARLPVRSPTQYASDAPDTPDARPHAVLLVDVGCGTGFLTAGLATVADRVIGVDHSEGMLNVARDNLDALGLTNVDLLPGNVGNLPIESNYADATFANMVLHHAPDPQIMVHEMVRIAKPGSRVVITDMESHTHEWFRVEMADVWLGFTENQVRQYMEAAGLVDVEFGWVGTQ